jgi:hypothetical protein
MAIYRRERGEADLLQKHTYGSGIKRGIRFAGSSGDAQGLARRICCESFHPRGDGSAKVGIARVQIVHAGEGKGSFIKPTDFVAIPVHAATPDQDAEEVADLDLDSFAGVLAGIREAECSVSTPCNEN